MKEILHSKPWVTKDDLVAVDRALRSGFIGSGLRTREFEHRLSGWMGVSHPGISVGSGSAALFLALKALGCGPRDEVIVPTYVCRAVLEAITATGARPVLCDVGEDWQVHPDNVAKVLTRKSKTLIVPHLYGIFGDVAAFRSCGLSIVEDCAQAVGPRTRTGISGDVAIFSFHPTKCFTAGEGGMAISSSRRIATRMRALRDGSGTGFDRQVFSPMSDMASALGLSQFSRYGQMLARRKMMASEYLRALDGCMPEAAKKLRRLRTIFYRFPIMLCGGLDRYRESFLKRGIHVRRGVDELLHRVMGLPDSEFPRAVELYRTTVSLPIYPALGDQDVRRCIASLKAVIEQVGGRE